MDKPSLVGVSRRAEALETHVANLFRRAGWKVRRPPERPGPRGDLLLQRGPHSYVAEIKSASESRPDRLIPLLAQAVLQAQAAARRQPEMGAPLAIVGTDRVSEKLVREAEGFARSYAPDVSVGLVTLDGFQWFQGPGLESLGVGVARAARQPRARIPVSASHLFSDLNQWMLKVLLAPGIPPDLLSAPRGEYRNASQLAGAAGVTVMSAFRLVRQLGLEGFLDAAASTLKLVRLEELFGRWQAANLRPPREVAVRWILRGDSERQLREALRAGAAESMEALENSRRVPKAVPRACLGVFAAADALGLGFVHGVPPYLYIEKLAPAALQRLGLSMEGVRESPDVYVRVPAARESVFRAAVSREGVPVSDVLQVWLDASAHPARGAEQSELIYRRVLRPLFGKRR
jgi:hypothetical protein